MIRYYAAECTAAILPVAYSPASFCQIAAASGLFDQYKVTFGGGAIMEDEEPKLNASLYPLIAYIHVPKAAGTTVRKVLSLCSPRGIDRLERLLVNNDEMLVFDFGDSPTLVNREPSMDYPFRISLSELAGELDWIAGHTPRDDVAKSLLWFGRPIEYFATIREPITQLISNLNYSFEKYLRGTLFGHQSSDEDRRDIAVISTDFLKPLSIINLLLTDKGLLNMQSRLLIGEDFGTISDSEITRRLKTYTHVSDLGNLAALYQAFGFVRLPDGIFQLRENDVEKHFNWQIFEHPDLVSFLHHHHRHDIRLYRAFLEISWPKVKRTPFRPSYLEVEPDPAEEFDEAAYLANNPDVAAAVKQGAHTSGREHYEHWGRAERRKIKKWVFSPGNDS